MRLFASRFTTAGLLALVVWTIPESWLSAASPEPTELAPLLIEQSGLDRGVCSVVAGDPELAFWLAQSSRLLVHYRGDDRAVVDQLQRRALAAGMDLGRLAAEQGDLTQMPYADHLVDLVVIADESPQTLANLPATEVLRAMVPGGVVLVRQPDGNNGAAQLKRWTEGLELAARNFGNDDNGHWLRITKGALAGADDWSHWEKSPDNNPVSDDTVIKAPYLSQFFAEPYYIGMPAITTVAGGRTFLAIGHIAHHEREWNMVNKLIARNGYNGQVLWEQNLPEGYLVHRSAFIATDDIFYRLAGDHVLKLDPKTGRELGELRFPGVAGDLKWMALLEGRLFVLAGKPGDKTVTTKGDREFGGWSWADLSPGYYADRGVPYGMGTTLAAYDIKAKQVAWKHDEPTPIDSRGLAIRDGKLYFYCPQAHFRCLDAASGKPLWTNAEAKLREVIEEKGKGLTSTPGWKTQTLVVATPDALIVQGQTLQNVVSVSTKDGRLLWTKSKVTNNPNAIFVDGKVIVGVGRGGSHVALDPVTGSEYENLGFFKRACTRLTACSDSFFTRGEGMMRYDRAEGKIKIDGGIRPGCNDGAIPANGLLYLGPWQCDCNLSMIGAVAKASAGEFRFDYVATDEERLQATAVPGPIANVSDFLLSDKDWPTYRGDIARSSSTSVPAPRAVTQRWQHPPAVQHTPAPAVSAGNWVFAAGSDGAVRGLDRKSGQVRWEFFTGGPIKASPTVDNGFLYVGSGDGYVYALEAISGKQLWKFRAAPIERQILVYGALLSTWPVNSGVLVQDGVAYFAAGILDHDGTYVYAVDAETGKLKWQNGSSGHLNADLRKGVSVQGNLTIQGDRLLLASGNQVSPAPFELSSGRCLAESFEQGAPKANGGQFVGVFAKKFPIAGGRVLYSAPENVSTKGSFEVHAENETFTLNYGGIAPAWNDQVLTLINYRSGKLVCCDAKMVTQRITAGYADPPQGADRRYRRNLAVALQSDGAVRWQTDLGESHKFEAQSLVICPNAVVAVVQFQQRYRSQRQWFAAALDIATGEPIWKAELRAQPLPGGLLVDRGGQTIVTMLDGSLVCIGPRNE